MRVAEPRSTCSQSCAFGEPWSPQIGFVPMYEPCVTGRPLSVKPSTAFAGLVAWAAGLVVVNEAVAVLPLARLIVLPDAPDRSTPAFCIASVTRALSDRPTWLACFSGRLAWKLTEVALPSSTLTAPVVEFHVTCE